jgi:putative intracellular protease/amidase
MTTRTIHLAVYDALADWEYGAVAAAINDPQFQAYPGTFRIVTVGEGHRPVTTMGGVRIVPDRSLDELDPYESAMLVLPGAHGWDTGDGIDAGRWTDLASHLLDLGTPVAGICGATFGLANAGLLDDREHTSSALEYLEAASGYRGADRYIDADAINDGGLITAGTTQPVAFAREILAELGVYSPAVLEAWFGLYSTHDPKWFHALMTAAREQRVVMAAAV